MQAAPLLTTLVRQRLQADDEREGAVAARKEVLHSHGSKIHDVGGAADVSTPELDFQLQGVTSHDMLV